MSEARQWAEDLVNEFEAFIQSGALVNDKGYEARETLMMLITKALDAAYLQGRKDMREEAAARAEEMDLHLECFAAGEHGCSGITRAIKEIVAEIRKLDVSNSQPHPTTKQDGKP